MDHDRAVDAAVLARCVGDPTAFAARHWGRSPMLRRGAGPFDDLLDLDAVDAVLLATPRRPTFRLVREGATLPLAGYTTTVRVGGASVEDAADVARIAGHVAAGATLVLQGLQRTWPPLVRFCRALERATSHAVQANAYLSPAGTAGLGRHADTHDVLVVQLEGSKAWDVDGLGGLRLDAGDVLYLPAGTLHSAAAAEEASLHLTIGLLRDTYRKLVERALAEVAELDEALPIGYAAPGSADALARELAGRLEAAAKALLTADPQELAEAQADAARRRRKPLGDGWLRSVLAAPGIDGDTELLRRADNRARLLDGPDGEDGEDGEDGRIVLELADRRLHLPAFARPAVEHVLGRRRVRVGDLPGLDPEGRVVLARRLVREGLLVTVSGRAPSPR